MADQCDCLNDCGDDPRVGLYQVEPCPGALRYAKRQLAKLQAEAAKQQAEVARRQDAARYRVLRAMHWNSSPLAVVRDPKRQVRLGADCPSLERLDAELDAFIAEMSEVGRG